MSRVLHGRPLVAGVAEGPLLFSRQPLSLWGGLDPRTGRVIDRRHEFFGRCVTGSVLALPRGRGSSTASAVLLDAIRRRTAPAAILLCGVDLILTLGSVVADEVWGDGIPIVTLSQVDFAELQVARLARVRHQGDIEVE